MTNGTKEKNFKIFALFIGMILLVFPSFSQNIKLRNGGFEDRARQGTSNEDQVIKGWFDCGRIDFPAETPPDIHQGVNRKEAFWDNEQASAQGSTYLGMVVRETDSFESLSQKLSLPLKAGKCYSFSVYLSMSPTYFSHVSNGGANKKNFSQPIVMVMYGANGFCGEAEVLFESPLVDHSEWKLYNFKIEPSRDYNYIKIAAKWKSPVLFPYNGHVLVDGASDFKLIPCDEEVAMYVANEVKEKQVVERKMPAHKARKKKEVVFERGSKDTKVDTIVYSKKKQESILSLDRKSIKKGQNIRIDKLYFDADTSAINVESYEVLNEVYHFLNDNQDIKVEIQGHTNNIPPHDYCNTLSTNRAKAVAKYLVAKGIPGERIKYKGWGKRKPVASNGTPEGRKQNQRVEIKIISIG